jgi:hypothetical protein
MQSFSDIDIKGIRIEKDVGLKNNHGMLLKLVQANGKPIVYQVSLRPAHVRVSHSHCSATCLTLLLASVCCMDQTPVMTLAWTCQVRVQEKGQTTCNLPLSLGSTNKDIVEFKSWLNALREHAKNLVKSNVVAWYGSPLTDSQINDYMAPLIKEPLPNTGYSAVFLPKLAHEEGKQDGFVITVKAFGIDKREMNTETALVRGNRVGAIVKVPYIHVGKGNKQLSLRSDVTQCLVLPNADEVNFAFNIVDDPTLQAAADEAQQQDQKRQIEHEEEEHEEEDNAVVAKKSKTEVKGETMPEFDAEVDV